jgi:hypothetical protein
MRATTRSLALILAAAITATVAFAEGTPIVTLQKRDKTITIKTTPEGKLYTIKDTKSGRVLAEDLTEDQLQATHKDLHNLVNTGLATPGSKEYLDATNSLPAEPKAKPKR